LQRISRRAALQLTNCKLFPVTIMILHNLADDYG
jgi:hypothetical protein